MSVKGKVKRCNKEIEKLKQNIEAQAKYIAHIELQENNKTKLLENIIKFAITNHIGNLKGGMMIDCDGVDKMNNLSLDIQNNNFEHTYMIRVRY